MPLFGSGGEKLGGNGQPLDEETPKLPDLRTFIVTVRDNYAPAAPTHEEEVRAHEFGNSAGMLIFMQYIETAPGRAREAVAAAYAAGTYTRFRESYDGSPNETRKGRAH